jgi:cell pole-organizing protein PopZ
MSQAQKAPEPGMEDLLASIRKAINDDSTAKSQTEPGSRESPTGSDEQRRPPSDRPQSEILELRNRIAGQLAERPSVPLSQRPSGFASILSGDAGRPRPPVGTGGEPPRIKTEEQSSMGQAPGLRQSYADTEKEPGDILPSIDEPRYADQPADDDDRLHDDSGDPPPYRRAREPREPYSLPGPHRYGNSSRETGMLSPEAAAGTEAAFSRLADTLMSRATSERSIEDITRELLRPMLKQWLDENLPVIVERLVREEIERVARRGGR